jgi:CRISPR/Cas system CMR-associated protein Cmr5 small subunit
MNFEEGPNDGEEPNDGNVFYYNGIEGEITRNVTVVRVESRVRVIRDGAFDNCRALMTIFFNERLDLIGVKAFRSCHLLQSINIPRYVRVIEKRAFSCCHGLMTADLGEGIEIIGAGAFEHCYSLQYINIPGGVTSIQRLAFAYCRGLTTLVLNNGLRVIEYDAFTNCISLECIVVPPTVREIHEDAFSSCEKLSHVILQNGLETIGSCAFFGTSIESIKIPPSVEEISDDAFANCSNLTQVVFCDMIENFVSKTRMKYWWNHGVHEKCLSTYCFLVRDTIPMKVRNLTQSRWHINIHNMLQRIPSIAEDNLHLYFDSINEKLQLYSKLKDVPALLELVMWKFTIVTNLDENEDMLSADEKTKCREKSMLMVRKIVPPILSFLTGDDYTDLWDPIWSCRNCRFMNDEFISKGVFGDINEGSRVCVMCYAYR